MSATPESAAPPGGAPPDASDAPDDFVAELGPPPPHDRRDPDPWWTVHSDRSLPLDPQTKAALLLDARSFSRRFFLPLLRPLARTFLVLVGLFRTLVPRALTSSRLLHWLIYVGLRHFVSPQACFLILRHFHLGSNISEFLVGELGRDDRDQPAAPAGRGRRQGRPLPAARSQPL